eukprot:GHVP01054056.1.p1 GENE.GHVP01054056.1~~GHVP01054056.1.p1  ORF type:complete len:283 (+),score=55.74 GHVP01054056.1:555-1403(+)
MSSNYAVFLIGPAGSGKSSLCNRLYEHYDAVKRRSHIMNLDPSTVSTKYKPALDIREYFSIEDIITETESGPNGALIACLEKALENDDWITDDLTNREDDFVIVDLPGQIEIYTHFDIMQRITDLFTRNDYRICVITLLEAHFLQEPTKFLAGALSTLAGMINIESPHLCVVSKIDLIKQDKEQDEEEDDSEVDDLEDLLSEDSPLSAYFYPDPQFLLEEMDSKTSDKYYKLNKALADIIEDYNLVHFLPVSIKNQRSIEMLAYNIDMCVQYEEEENNEDIE